MPLLLLSSPLFFFSWNFLNTICLFSSDRLWNFSDFNSSIFAIDCCIAGKAVANDEEDDGNFGSFRMTNDDLFWSCAFLLNFAEEIEPSDDEGNECFDEGDGDVGGNKGKRGGRFEDDLVGDGGGNCGIDLKAEMFGGGKWTSVVEDTGGNTPPSSQAEECDNEAFDGAVLPSCNKACFFDFIE